MEGDRRGPLKAMRQNKHHFKLRVASLLLAGVTLFSSAAPALADEFSAREKELQDSINASQQQISSLRKQQDTLNNKIAILNAEIAAINTQLRLSQVKEQQLKSEIAAAEAELLRQKEILGENVRIIYQSSGVSAIEMLASSNSFTDFIDKQQYLDSVMDNVTKSIDAVAALKKQLEEQQTQLAALIAEQKAQQASLNYQYSQQATLLAQTKGLEANYQKSVNDSNAALKGIYAERAKRDAANNTTVSTGGTGGYPWANGPRCSVEGCAHDGYTYYIRQCTSYAAWWRRSRSWDPVPYGWGHAYQWGNQSTSPVPKYGAVVVWGANSEPGIGWAGHVGIVERVNLNGTIDVSEYNWRPEVYSYRSGVPVHGGMRFIH